MKLLNIPTKQSHTRPYKSSFSIVHLALLISNESSNVKRLQLTSQRFHNPCRSVLPPTRPICNQFAINLLFSSTSSPFRLINLHTPQLKAIESHFQSPTNTNEAASCQSDNRVNVNRSSNFRFLEKTCSNSREEKRVLRIFLFCLPVHASRRVHVYKKQQERS
jgi:hypothetical protein